MRSAFQRLGLAAATSLLFLGVAHAQNELESLGKQLFGDKKTSTADLEPAAELPKFSAWVTSLAFTPDGQTLAVGTKDSVTLIDVAKNMARATLPVKVGQVRSLAISPDGRWLVAGGYQKLQVWELSPGTLSRELKGHRGVVTAVAFPPQDSVLASASDDETVRLWDLSRDAVTVLKGHSYPVTGLAWSPDGQRLATAAGDDTRPTKGGEVFLWDRAGNKLREWTDHKKAAQCVAFSADGQYLVTGGLDERAIVYDLHADKPLGFYGGHQRPVNAVIIGPNSHTAISIGGGRAKGGHLLKVWNLVDGEEIGAAEAHEAKILALAVSRDGRRAATGGQDQTVLMWDLGTKVGGSDADVLPVDATTVLAAVTERGAAALAAEPEKPPVLRIGIIGLDTSHAPAFAKLLNDAKAEADLAGCRVVAAYPKGSPDIVSSVIRVPAYTEELKKLDVEIADSIAALVEKVDCVLLETNDGRPHLEQVLPVLKAGKPCFIDKPIAGSLTDAVAIFEAARHYKTAVFSSSSLRYAPGAQEARAGKLGKILGCDAFSPASLEATHPDLFWYGIHGVELLFTTMGPGCESVARAQTANGEFCVGVWKDGRLGTFRGIRGDGSGYGDRAVTDKGTRDIPIKTDYRPLVVEIVKFFQSKQPPIAEEETLEIYAFMEAADVSKTRGGTPVKLQEVLDKAKADAQQKLPALLK